MTLSKTANQEQREQAKAKAKATPKAKAEKKAETPNYPKWPEIPATYTQTVLDQAANVLSTIEEKGYRSELEGAKNISRTIEQEMVGREEPFKKAEAKAWVTKEDLKTLFNDILAYIPDEKLEAPYNEYTDLDRLYRQGRYFFITGLAKKVKVTL